MSFAYDNIIISKTTGAYTMTRYEANKKILEILSKYIENNQLIGYIFDTQTDGYGGKTEVLVGITTDGKMYASSKVARDRDRLREQVLEGLGWKLYHLWSTDWYRNRDLGRKKLLESIEKSIKELSPF